MDLRGYKKILYFMTIIYLHYYGHSQLLELCILYKSFEPSENAKKIEVEICIMLISHMSRKHMSR